MRNNHTPNNPNLVYHYTAAAETHLFSILREGKIRQEVTSSCGIRNLTRCPAVWFSSNPHFEPTVVKFRDESGDIRLDEAPELYARIAVDPEGLFTFDEYCRWAPGRFQLSHRQREIFQRQCGGLARTGIEQGGNPAHWFVSFDPVPASAFRAVQSFRDGQWVDRLPDMIPFF